MFIKSLSTTPLQIFCKIVLNGQVIDKSIIDPDDSVRWNRMKKAFHAEAQSMNF